MKISVPFPVVRALVECASRDETRFNLNGVHIDEKGLVATNGHVMARFDGGVEIDHAEDGSSHRGVTLSSRVIDLFCSRIKEREMYVELHKKPRDPVRLHISQRKGGKAHAVLDGDADQVGDALLDGQFPAWQQMFEGAPARFQEKDVPRTLASFDIEELKHFERLTRLSKDGRYVMRLDEHKRQSQIVLDVPQNGLSPIGVRIGACPAVRGLIMPMRHGWR